MSRKQDGPSCSLCCTKLENFNVKIGSSVLLYDVNLHIHCGELTALIGPNGAGKSTLLKAMLGEIPYTGTLSYLDAKGFRTGKPLIGYVPQTLDIDKGSPASVLDFCTACVSTAPVWLAHPGRIRKRAHSNLSMVQAEYLLDRKIGELSGGELQRVMLACALDPVPDLLLLDEPVSGVDPHGLDLFYKMVSDLRNRFDLSIILVSHDLGLVAKFADRLVFLNKTVHVSGPPGEVLGSEMVARTFGTAAVVLPYPDHAVATINHHPEK